MALNELDSDDFVRANEDPLSGSGNWVSGDGIGFVTVSNAAGAGLDNGDNTAYWNSTSRNYTGDQWSEITVGEATSGNYKIGVAVLCDSDDWLGIPYDANAFELYLHEGPSTWTKIGTVSAGAGATSDVLRLEIEDGAWVIYDNEVEVDSDTGFTTLTDGQPGMYGVRNNSGYASAASWRAGDFAAGSSTIPPLFHHYDKNLR